LVSRFAPLLKSDVGQPLSFGNVCDPAVYFLINTCLLGLRSSKSLSNEVSRVHHHRPDGEEREEKEREGEVESE